LRAIILDETFEIGEHARRVLAPRGVALSFAGSVEELQTAVGSSGFRDLLIVNLGGDLGGWQVAEHLRRSEFDGRTLALVDSLGDPDVSYLMKCPRTECVVRPTSTPLLEDLLDKAVSDTRFARSLVSPFAPASPRSFHGIVGKSASMLEIFSRIEKAAAGDANVCIYGESGTGKELIARAIHQISARRDRPFVTLDCTAIPEGLVESHLFGHVKGAFTGAVDHREGVFSLAHTGTLFIDELCELSLPMQAKLLRVLQAREFSKVGGSKPIRTDIRIVTATNKEPKKAVEAGAFREDLYYRVAVVMISVPPLRERKADIPPLVEHFLQKFSASYHEPIRCIAPAAMDRLMSLPWPGNVRELENFIEQTVVLTEGDSLTERDLPLDTRSPNGDGLPGRLTIETGLPLREVERRYILRTLHDVQGNRADAARRLGISVRSLQYKLKAYVAEPAQVSPAGPVTAERPIRESLRVAY
jgi:DNA-binding NtrC family response regulator